MYFYYDSMELELDSSDIVGDTDDESDDGSDDRIDGGGEDTCELKQRSLS